MKQKPPQEALETFDLPELVDNQAFILLIIAAQLLVMLVMLFEYGIDFDWQYFASLTIYIQWQVICSALGLSIARPYLLRMGKNTAATASFILLLLISAVVAVMSQWYLHPESLSEIDAAIIARNVAISAIVAGVALRYLFVQQSLIQRENAALLASLSALQARIKPHFLFNTMNSIASLISIAPEKAEKMVEDLSDLLRASLQEETIETTIEQEWDLCERYLAIEKLRLDERLNWHCDLSQIDGSLAIPSLSLQPIVENAIYHGVQPSPEPGYIHVTANYNKTFVEIRVKNSQSKAYQTARTNKGNKMAIVNTRNRIKQLYGASSDLIMTDLGDSFEVCLRYQPHKRENDSDV